MSAKVTRLAWGSVLAGCVVAVGLLTQGRAQNDEPAAIEELIPVKTVMLIQWDGSDAHAEGFEKTAAHEALFESGLVPTIVRTIEGVAAQAPEGGEAFTGPVAALIKHIYSNGVTFAVSIAEGPPNAPPLPQGILILPQGAEFAEALTNLAAAAPGAEIQERKAGGRTVRSILIPDTPGIELGWWSEGQHLALVVGMNAVGNHIAVVSGDAPNLTASTLWKKYGGQPRTFERTTLFWLDVGGVRDVYGGMPLPIPSPEPVTIDQIARAVGLHNMGAVVAQNGYRGEAMWAESTVEIDGEPTGLLALGDQKPITLDDLPPLPEDTQGFAATSIDMSKVYTDVRSLVLGMSAFGPPGSEEQIAEQFDALPQMIGFDPKADFCDALGGTVCVYSDRNQESFYGIAGFAVVMQVKDAEKLRRTVNQMLAIAEGASDGAFRAARVEKRGRELIMFEGGGFQGGGLCIDDDWMILALVPQTVETFLMRVDGKLPSWKPTPEIQKSLALLPNKYTSIVVSDPRVTYRGLLGSAPLLASFARGGIQQMGIFPPDFELPFNVSDIPPAELVTRPLFPNVMVSVADEDGFHWYGRSSLPSVPIFGDGGAGGVATVGVLVALLLPAVQQAREAARRAQSKNNLKQIAIALHNYHEAFNQFPTGTIPNEKLKPGERLSWIVSVLPFLDQEPLYRNIDRDAGWDDEENEMSTAVVIPYLLNPGLPDNGAGNTHYVGIAGVGKDAPTLGVRDKRAGVFGYNRVTKMRDIRDGTSNTIGVSEAIESGRWAAGGTHTIRALTKKPYINGPDGLGSRFSGGCNMMLMDGSVRFISENIDPSVMEALSTINGGERIGPF